MKLESDHWKLEAVEVQDAEELFWPTSPTRYYTIPRSTQRPSTTQVILLDNKHSPTALKQLALEAFLDQLKNLCLAKNYGENKRSLKHYLKFQLPSPLRQQLLNLSMRENRIYTLVDLNMFELLLSTTVRHVNVHAVRSFFRQQFVTSLRQLGTGLEQLAIQDSSWLQRRDNLPAALSRMTHLRRISLRFLANDMMIAALARNCHHIQEMDVCYSLDVTDEGIKILCDPDDDLITKLEQPQTREKQSNEQRCRKISAPARTGGSGGSSHIISGAASGCMVWFPRLVRGMRRHSVVEQKQHRREPIDCFVYQDGEETTSPLWPEDEEFPTSNDSGEISPSCIRSLRRLELLGTSVTSKGVQFVLAASPTLTVIT